MPLQAGQIIEGKYRIVRLLGEGGMGAVYEGENVRIHRRVAIKVLHGGITENADVVQRFEREAQAAGRIGSDHIVEVIDLGNLPDGERFMVMEYLDGESLSQRIQSRGRLPPADAAPLMLQLLEGLGAAHGAGIFHRDLKPDNIYLLRSKMGQGDFVKILDFGISKFNKLNKDSGMSMTRTGAVMGTPYYMSPEQAKGSKEMDHRSDLYSAGVILYEAITGQVPFNAETFNELIFKIVLESPPSPESLAPGLDAAFGSIMQKAMAREPADRFQSAQDFAAALRVWLGTGQGVVFAPAVPSQPRGPMGSAPMLGRTPAPWANTGGPSNLDATADGLPPRRSAAPWVISLALLGTIAVVGGVLFKVMQKGPATEGAAPAALAAPASPVAAAPPPEPAKAETPPKPAEPPEQQPVTVPPSASPAVAAPAPALPKRPAVYTPPAAKHSIEKPPVAAAAAVQAPPPPTAPAPPPTAAGRRIRTEL